MAPFLASHQGSSGQSIPINYITLLTINCKILAQIAHPIKTIKTFSPEKCNAEWNGV